MTDVATLRERLAEAEAAYHKLALGEAEASVTYGSTMVAYKSADLGKLKAYIADLKRQIAAAGDATMPRRRAIVAG